MTILRWFGGIVGADDDRQLGHFGVTTKLGRRQKLVEVNIAGPS
ncbi:hypothetical protein [Mycobacterium lepromatosis]